MQIITTEALLTKYNITRETVINLLTPLSSSINILPVAANYMPIKMVTDSINDDVLFIGGHDIVPFAILQNPCSDPDQTVYSDAPYACLQDPLFYIPEKVVGRIPDESLNPSFDYLQTVINNQIEHTKNKPTTSGWFNIVASVWKGISDFMSDHFQMNVQEVAPPSHNPDIAILGKKYHYLNLHGSQQTPYFYGQQGGDYPVALEPKPGYFKDGVVFTEACYGGWIQGRSRYTSIPLMALYSGAVGVVCSSMVAYGPANPPPDGADAMNFCFYNNLLKGMTTGQAFLNAKKDFMTMIIQNQGNLQPSNRKTLLEFNLYGNPGVSI